MAEAIALQAVPAPAGPKAEAEADLPKAAVRKVVKAKLAQLEAGSATHRDIQVHKDALLAFQEGTKVFISFLTATANDICKDAKRQTISADDVYAALAELELEELLPPLQQALEVYKQDAKAHAKRKAGEAAALVTSAKRARKPSAALADALMHEDAEGEPPRGRPGPKPTKAQKAAAARDTAPQLPTGHAASQYRPAAAGVAQQAAAVRPSPQALALQQLMAQGGQYGGLATLLQHVYGQPGLLQALQAQAQAPRGPLNPQTAAVLAQTQAAQQLALAQMRAMHAQAAQQGANAPTLLQQFQQQQAVMLAMQRQQQAAAAAQLQPQQQAGPAPVGAGGPAAASQPAPQPSAPAALAQPQPGAASGAAGGQGARLQVAQEAQQANVAQLLQQVAAQRAAQQAQQGAAQPSAPQQGGPAQAAAAPLQQLASQPGGGAPQGAHLLQLVQQAQHLQLQQQQAALLQQQQQRLAAPAQQAAAVQGVPAASHSVQSLASQQLQQIAALTLQQQQAGARQAQASQQPQQAPAQP